MLRLHLTCNVYLYFCKRIFGNYSLQRLYDFLSLAISCSLVILMPGQVSCLSLTNMTQKHLFHYLPSIDQILIGCGAIQIALSILMERKSVNLCNLRIVNGRIEAVGASTCFTPHGSGLVDYFVTSIQFFEFLSDFSIGDLSDHCPIVLVIVTNSKVKPTAMYEKNNTEKKSNSHARSSTQMYYKM